MKKVININFQGQVIPIEETAYEMLQNYVASLRNYFANEEGRDEIINDIESRIAELFGEQLKKGAACITDVEVTRIMNSMGRPEDFDASEETAAAGAKSENTGQTSAGTGPAYAASEGRGRLYRDEQDKVIGGVASGLANYFKIDPAIIRVIFVALFFGGGSGLLVYIILWIILPSRSLVTNIRKRLFRDPDEKVIAGVAGGLAKYFDINPAIPRVIFAAPFILGIISSVFDSVFWGFPGFIGSFGGGTFIMAYIILWIVLPEARTAAEKLEMKGEKVDLNSIRNTIVGDLEGVKNRAVETGHEIRASVSEMGSDVKEAFYAKSSQMGPEVRYAARRTGSGIGDALAILIKAFFYFIIGIIAFVLFMLSIGLLVGGVSVYPLHDFLLQGPTQHFAAWGAILLFLGVPVIALLVFIIRRLMGVKKNNPIIGYTFAGLWVIGLVCFFVLLGTINRSFLTQVGVKENVGLTQPTGNKLKVMLADKEVIVYNDWFDSEGLLNISRDTLFLNTVKVNVVKSKDGLYHAHLMKISKGNDRSAAESLAEKIDFKPTQNDSILYLPPHFAVSHNDKWRNQKVIVVIEVPEGKYVEIDESVEDYHYFNIQFNRRNRRGDWDINIDDDYDNYRKGQLLQMTPDGLKGKEEDEEGNNGGYRFDEEQVPAPPPPPSLPDSVNKADTPVPVIEKKEKEVYRYSQKIEMSPVVALAKKMRLPSNPLNIMLRF